MSEIMNMLPKDLTKTQGRNILLGVVFSILFCLVLKTAMAANESTGFIKLPTNCTQVGDKYECEATTDNPGNSTFFVSVGELGECPYTCCAGEANYTDKACSTGYACKSHKCVSTTIPTITTKDNTVILTIVIGAVVILVLAGVYILLKRNQKAKSSKTFGDLYQKYRGKKPRRTRR